MKEIFIDAIRFNPDYIGGFEEWNHLDRGRKQAVIRPMSTGLKGSLKLRTTTVPYKLTDDDVVTVDRKNCRFIVAVPNTNIPGVNVDETEFHTEVIAQLETSASHWEAKYEEERRQKNKYKKKWERLADEEAEREKAESVTREKRYECDACEKKSPESLWEQNNWLCPECGDGEVAQE